MDKKGDENSIQKKTTGSSQIISNKIIRRSSISTATGTSSGSPSTNQLRLLSGKLVFLDINTTYKHLNDLKQCLITIGVTLADCMSKDVNFVITNRVKYEDLSASNVSTTVAAAGDSMCSNKKSLKTSPTLSHFSSRMSAINRTQTILEKAAKVVCTDILTNARRLGIQIIHVSEVEKYVDKYMNKMKLIKLGNTTKESHNSQQSLNSTNASVACDNVDDTASNNYRVRNLKSPYLKYESICKQYKPVYWEFSEWHNLILDSTKQTNNSPFQIYFNDEAKDSNVSSSSNNQTNTVQGNAKNTQAQTNQQSQSICEQQNTSSRIQLQQQQTTTATINIQQIKNTLIQRTTSTLNGTSNQLKLIQTPAAQQQQKRKQAGYCECCKQRYDNLKQHITSIQHENYEKNLNNFKDIDTYIDSSLNFEKFISRLNETVKEQTVSQQENDIEISTSNDAIKTTAKSKCEKLIDRLIFESKSLGELKSTSSRRQSTCKYTDISNKDFNTVLLSTTNHQIHDDNKQQSQKKRKRNQMPSTQSDTIIDKKPIKIKLEKNKSNNNWQISSSSLDMTCTTSQIDLDRHFDNALFQLAEINETEEPNSLQQSTPSAEQICKKQKVYSPPSVAIKTIQASTNNDNNLKTTGHHDVVNSLNQKQALSKSKKNETPKKEKKTSKKLSNSKEIKAKQAVDEQQTHDLTKLPLFRQNQTISRTQSLTLNYINRSPTHGLKKNVEQSVPQHLQQQQQQKENYYAYAAPSAHMLLPMQTHNMPVYNDPLQFFMYNQFVHSRIEPPLPPPPPPLPPAPVQTLQQPQQIHNNANHMRLSLNSSTGNIFDTLSAANSLINNF